MDFWKNEYDSRTSSSVLAGMQEYVDTVNSPTMSTNSALEYSSDSIASDQDTPKVVPDAKSALLAKKRLQAYCTVSKFNQSSVTEEKKEGISVEKSSKSNFKKTKKTYPDDAAKAVIRDIEVLKKAGYGGPSQSALPPDILIPTEPIIPISLHHLQGEPSAVSMMSDLEEENLLFKKREIRCKNIRKSQIYHGRSSSPKSRNDKNDDSHRKDKMGYPTNWTEYKEMGLNHFRHSSLKSRLLRKSRDRKFDFKRYFDLQVPPVPIELYRYLSKAGESLRLPFLYLRCTAAKPQVLYSTNLHVASPGYLTREQLFTLVPKDRRLVIEKLGKLSRCEVDSKVVTARKWYPKSWKKIDYSEAKLLESSVGLSFLQGYSDEEEEELLQENNHGPPMLFDVFEKAIDFVKPNKDTKVIQNKTNVSHGKEELTPPGSPTNLVENLDKEGLQNAMKMNKCRWDDSSDATERKNMSNYNKTPPLEDKEEGEVVSEEDHANIEESLADISIDDYEKTKEELKELEAVLKCSTELLEDDVITKEVHAKKIKKPDQRKPKKVVSKRTKNRKSKKRSKKKLEKKEKDDTSSDVVEPQEEVSKKKKSKRRNKDSKAKSESDKKRKARKKKSKMKKVAAVTTESEAVKQETSSETRPVKRKKKKRREGEKIRKRTVSEDLQGDKVSDRKNSADIAQEEYEDEFKFFAARFDAEKKLKGKTRHKTKANISLEELTLHPKTEEKPQKKKNKWESSESDGLFSPETLRKKSEQRSKEELSRKNKDKDKSISDESVKKTEVKIDLLKMNEEYLKERKRKEERDSSVAKDDDKTENSEVPKRDSRSLSIEKTKIPQKDIIIVHSATKELLDDKSAKIPDANKPHHEEMEKEIPTIILIEPEINTTTKPNKKQIKDIQLDVEQIRSKRKRHASRSVGDKAHHKKSKHNLAKDPIIIDDEEILDLIPLENIKKEKDITIDTETCQLESSERNNSWESDEELGTQLGQKNKSLDLEIPLNIRPFARRDIKVEESPILPAEIRPSDKTEGENEIIEKEQLQPILQQPPPLPDYQAKTTRAIDPDNFDVYCETPPAKKGRWDIKKDSGFTSSSPSIKLEKPTLDESVVVIDLDASSSSNNCVTLENEYEEFMKALTTTENDYNSPRLSNSDSSVTVLQTCQNEKTILFKAGDGKVLKPFEELVMPKPILDIPTIQIPLPPSMPEPIKPVPVPSPKLGAVFDLNKPLINLSLSANVTQNITLSLATSMPSISAPITSTIDLSKTCVEISAPNTFVSMNNIPLPVHKTWDPPPPPPPPVAVPEVAFSPNMSIPTEAETLLLSTANALIRGIPPVKCIDKKPPVFTALTLPSKKRLSSKLKLDDSDTDDQLMLEELKRKKLEALIADNERDALIGAPPPIKLPPEIPKEPVEMSANTKSFSSKQVKEPLPVSAPKVNDRRAETSPRRGKGEPAPSVRRPRDLPVKRRDPSPSRRRSSPPKRRSPRRSSPKRRSPARRKKSPLGKRISGSPRRRRGSDVSPRRRRSPSPRRKRSTSPRGRLSSPRRIRSPHSPRSKRSSGPKDIIISHSETSSSSQRRSSGRPKSPPPINQREGSPLKRSVADSTISDDQLLQAENYCDSFKLKEADREYQSPIREPLDVRISQVLGYDEPSKVCPPEPQTFNTFYHHEHIQPQQQQHCQIGEQYSSIQSQVTLPSMRNVRPPPQSTYMQVGNMLQIVPTDDDLTEIPMPHQSSQIEQMSPHSATDEFQSSSSAQQTLSPVKTVERKQRILQVGNMLQIVPTEMVPTEMAAVSPIHTEIKMEQTEEDMWFETSIATPPEKTSAEASMLLKVAERRAERDTRRQEREKRRKEKEGRRKEKEKARQAKLKIRTENMIKRALELEEEEDGLESDNLLEQPVQWPPLPIVISHSVFKEPGKSILINSGFKQFDESIIPEGRKNKIVQFADGIRPGEGTSPSAGEDLTSPPPPKKKLPKEKRYKKIKFEKKGGKKKVKVKIIKKPPSPLDESDSDEDLPPPSPPPGSPPPHIFPPRIKVGAVNNVPAAYLASIIQTAQQQQQPQQSQQAQYQSTLFRPPINLIMAPPPLPQGHLSSVPVHVQSPHGATGLSPQTHYHPVLAAPPPPPPLPVHSTGHNRHYSSR